jgi:hypothetical protein
MRRDALIARAERIGAKAVKCTLGRLSGLPVPDGVTAEVVGDAIILSGRALFKRMIDDPDLRRFGR